jgi:three-Cys-motif partner protein
MRSTKQAGHVLPEPENDGLIIPEVGAWSDRKYRHVANYASIFATSMKRKWRRVYLDLFAGAGYARIGHTNRIVRGSPLLALHVPDEFDLYAFCEKDDERMAALRSRAARERPILKPEFIDGDVNDRVAEIVGKIPPASRKDKVLTFCFADIYALENLSFATVRALAAARFMDFLILIPTGMDAVRNFDRYTDPANGTVARFLGRPNWRSEWKAAKDRGESVENFLLSAYKDSMAELRYIHGGWEDTRLVRSTVRNLRLYHLAFFSRNELGRTFWKEAKKYSDPQQDLGF